MKVELITNKEGKAIGWTIDADKNNQSDVNILNTIRNLQFFGFDATCIEYDGREGGDEHYAGKLSWKQRRYKDGYEVQYTITEENFLNWFYSTGADQDQQEDRTSMGERVIEALKSDGDFKINAKEIFENECEHSTIPMKYLSEVYDTTDERELGDLDYKYKVTLVK